MAKKKLEDNFDALFSDALDAVNSTDAQEMEIEIEVVEEGSSSRAHRGHRSGIDNDYDIDLDAELEALGETPNDFNDAALITALRSQLEEANADREYLSQQLQKAKRVIVLQKQKGSANVQSDRDDEAYSTLKEEHQDLQERLEKSRIEQLERSKMVQSAREQIKKLEERNQKLTSDRGTLLSRNGEYKEKLEQLKTRIKRIQDRRKKESNESKNFGLTPAVKALIPTIENIERALRFADSNPESVTEGIQMALEQLYANFAKLGMLRVEASPGTAFDPEVHEAMMRVSSSEFAENEIVEEVSAGFTLNQRLIRAAKVSVAASGDAESDAVESNGTESHGAEEEAPADIEATSEPEETPLPIEAETSGGETEDSPVETVSEEGATSEPEPLDLGDLSLPDFADTEETDDEDAASETVMPTLSAASEEENSSSEDESQSNDED